MSYGIFNYENDEIGTCMMLIYDLEEPNQQQKNNVVVNNKTSAYKYESEYSIKSRNSEETTNRKQRPMSGMSYQKKQVSDTNFGFNQSKQSDYNFFGSSQTSNGVNSQNNQYMQQNPQNNNNNNNNNNNMNNLNSNTTTQTYQSINQPINQSNGYMNGNQYFSGQKPMQPQQQQLQQQQYQQQQQQLQNIPQSNEYQLQYQTFTKMMKNMDEDTFKSFMQQYQMEQQIGKQKPNYM
ncbi:hypothetical protein ABPG74_021427 [Tetrahymena malaccensis]